MPIKPLSHAQRQGRTLADRAYDQMQRAADPVLAQAKHVRSSARWRRVRAFKLAAQPLCADIYGVHTAQGHVEVATQVDHIRGLHEAPELAYTLENLQALCSRCHSLKSQSERKSKHA